MADAPATAEKPYPAPLDPVAEGLRRQSEILARLAALEDRLHRTAEALAYAQHAQPPLHDSVRTYTVREAKKILNVSQTWLYAAITGKPQRIPAVKINGRWLIPHSGLARLLKGERPDEAAATETQTEQKI